MPRYFPNPDEFRSIVKSADLVPVYRQLLADHLTPVTAFELLGKQEHALLLESVVGNEKIGRYSFIASGRSEEHTSELQSQSNLVCRLLLDKKKTVLDSFMS